MNSKTTVFGSNSTLKNKDREAVGVGFWGVDALKLALKKPLEMLLYWRSVVKEDNHTKKKNHLLHKK